MIIAENFITNTIRVVTQEVNCGWAAGGKYWDTTVYVRGRVHSRVATSNPIAAKFAHKQARTQAKTIASLMSKRTGKAPIIRRVDKVRRLPILFMRDLDIDC